MKAYDVVIHTNGGVSRSPEELRSNPPLVCPFTLGSDLTIDRVDPEVAARVLDMGDPTPYGIIKPTRQFAQLYSFVRTVPTLSSAYDWDQDTRLQTAVALSRLVHPTSLSFRYAARVRLGEQDQIQDIHLAEIRGVGIDTFLGDTSARDWLSQDDAESLKQLLSALDSSELPSRVSRAMWHFEYASRVYYVELRWTLIATGLEALVHTDMGRSTRQFKVRVSKMATELGMTDLNEADAGEAYHIRSRLAHGSGLESLTAEKRDLYGRMENVLRKALLRAITDSNFSHIFDSDQNIRTQWVVP